MPITVMSVSADTAFHFRLRTLLATHREIDLLAEVCENDAHMLRRLRDLQPDVLLMDGQGHATSRAALLLQIGVASPATKTMLFFDCFGQADILEAVVQGAKGCIRKTSDPQHWLKAIQAIQAGDIWVDRKVLVDGLNRLLHPLHDRLPPIELKPQALTLREWEVVNWVGQGMTNKEIARKLVISNTTVKTHLQNIFNKLKVGRRMQLPVAHMQPSADGKFSDGLSP